MQKKLKNNSFSLLHKDDEVVDMKKDSVGFTDSSSSDPFPNRKAHSTITNNLNGPRREKTCLWGFQLSETQTSLLSYRN